MESLLRKKVEEILNEDTTEKIMIGKTSGLKLKSAVSGRYTKKYYKLGYHHMIMIYKDKTPSTCYKGTKDDLEMEEDS
jgi:hypothetical protein